MLTRFITLRSIRYRFTRFILSAFGIILGVAGMLAINVTNQTALDSIVDLFNNTSGKAKISVVSAKTETEGINQDILITVKNFPEIAIASPILKQTTSLLNDQRDDQLDIGLFGTESGGFLIYGIDPEKEIVIREYILTQGQFISSTSLSNEIVLVESFADDEDIKLDDWIDILTPFGFEPMKVVGLISKEGPGQTNNGNFGLLTLSKAQELFDRRNKIDQIDILPSNNEISGKPLEELKEALQKRLGEKLSVIYPASQGERMTKMLESYQIGLNFLSGMALFVGAFLIYNAFAMTVVERTREFGMLRTVGMTKQQVRTQILIEAGFLGVVGSGFGLGLGFLLSRGLTRLMEIILIQELGQVAFPSHLLLSSFLIGVLVTVIAAFIPIWQSGKISPLEALRARGNKQEGWFIRNGWIAGIILFGGSTILLIINPFPYDNQFKLGSLIVFGLFTGVTLLIPATIGIWEPFFRWVIQLIYGASGGLGSRNIQRSKIRTTLTIAALLVGVSMVMMVRVITQSFATDLRSWMEGYIGGDLYVSSSINLRGDFSDRLASVSGVSEVAPIRYLDVEWRTPNNELETINYMAVDPVAYSRVASFVFSDPKIDIKEAIDQLINTDSIFISSVLSEKYGLTKGDMIQLKTRNGYHDFRISGVVVDFFNQGNVIQGSWDNMRRYFRLNDASVFLVKIDSKQVVNDVSMRIDDIYGKRYQLTITSNDVIKRQAFSLMDQAFSMFDIMSLIAVVVGSLGIVNTLTMSVMERTREIGMLRATGMTKGQVILMILSEASVIGLVGGVLGLFSGLLLSRVILIGMTAMSGYRLDYVLPGLWMIISVVSAFIISQLAALLPARRAVRIKILDALHYE